MVANGFEKLLIKADSLLDLRRLGLHSKDDAADMVLLLLLCFCSVSSSSHSQWRQLDFLYFAMICIDVALDAMTGSSLETSQFGHGPGRTYVKISVSIPLHL